MRSTHQAVGVVSLDAVWVDDAVLGVAAGADAIPAVLLTLLPESVGDGHNAQGIAWAVDQRDFGAPEYFPFKRIATDPRAIEELTSVIREHLVPAVERILADGALHDLIRAQVLAEEPFESLAVVRAVAVLLSDGDAGLATAAVRRYAASEAADHAEYTSAPWEVPCGILEDLQVLQKAFPEFDPVAATQVPSRRDRG